MVWNVRIEKRATKQLAKLGHTAQALIQEFITERLMTCDDPRDFGKALKHDKSGLWRYRVDIYRLICSIEDNELTIYIVQIGKRDRIYED